jgi:hypothetical protein
MKLTYDEPRSYIAFEFHLRCYKQDKRQLDEMKNLRNPSASIKAVGTCVHLILNARAYSTRHAARKATWEDCRATLVANDFVQRMTSFEAGAATPPLLSST